MQNEDFELSPEKQLAKLLILQRSKDRSRQQNNFVAKLGIAGDGIYFLLYSIQVSRVRGPRETERHWRGVGGFAGGCVVCGVSCVMIGKSFLMLVVATLLGPAVGVGLFVLLNTM